MKKFLFALLLLLVISTVSSSTVKLLNKASPGETVIQEDVVSKTINQCYMFNWQGEVPYTYIGNAQPSQILYTSFGMTHMIISENTFDIQTDHQTEIWGLLDIGKITREKVTNYDYRKWGLSDKQSYQNEQLNITDIV